MSLKMKKDLLSLIENIQGMNALDTQYPAGTFAKGIGDDKVYASFDEATGRVLIKTEVMGTQYEGRSQRIESVSVGAAVKIVREPENQYNANNLAVQNLAEESLGNLSKEVCDALSPLIDLGLLTIENAGVSYVEPLSKRSKKAKKAILYVELKMKLEEIRLDNSNGCTICILGGDQIRMWAQELTVYQCSIPMAHAKDLFELYNRYHQEYDNATMDFMYVGLDNLVEEILDAREKMNAERKEGLDYSAGVEADTFGRYVLEMTKKEPERYGHLVQYIDENAADDYFEGQLNYIFINKAMDSQKYYWLDQTRVDSAEWDAETMDGFNHWYEIMELYSPDKELPFDLKDEDVVSIFGFGQFDGFADLSYGC